MRTHAIFGQIGWPCQARVTKVLKKLTDLVSCLGLGLGHRLMTKMIKLRLAPSMEEGQEESIKDYFLIDWRIFYLTKNHELVYPQTLYIGIVG